MIEIIRKQKYLIDFTLSSLLRRPGKNLGLLLVYSLIVFLLASVMLFTNALRSEAHLVLKNSPEIILQRMVAGRHDLIPASYLDKLGHLRGVREQHGRLWGYFYDPVVKANYTLMVPHDRSLVDNEIVIGHGIARTRGLAVGDYISFRKTGFVKDELQKSGVSIEALAEFRSDQGHAFNFKVADVLDAESELVSSDLILISESRFREFFSIPRDRYTDLVLSVRNPREVAKIAEKITSRLPDTRPILREEILRTYDAIFSWRQGIVFVLLIGAILAFVIFAWDKASGLSAEERKEIGVLKAIGWETADVIRMKFWEGALISFSAFMLGYLAAYLHVFYSSAVLFEPVLKGWAVLYPDFQPTPVVDPLQLVTLFFFTVLPYTVATIIPIWQAAITDPDAVMR